MTGQVIRRGQVLEFWSRIGNTGGFCMKKWVWIFLAVVLLALIGFKVKQKIDQQAALKQQGMEQKGNGGPGMRGGSTFGASMVSVKAVSPQPIRETLKLTGEIQADTEVAVQPRISGRLLKILVSEGDRIKANQIVAIMDDESIRIQMQQSEANIAGIKANLRQAEINVARAQTEQERYKELLDKKYISQRDYDSVENSYLASQSTLEVQKTQLESSWKNYELLKLQLTQTKVYSQIAGYVIDVPATLGTNLTTGSTIVTVAAVNPAKLILTVDQRDTAKIKPGVGVKFSCDIYPGQEFPGSIREIAPAYDPKTRTLSLTAKLRNDRNKLLPGIFGNAEILVGGKDDALVVPSEAVVTRDNQTGVFMVNGDKIAKFQPVVTGLQAEGQTEVVQGLKPGDLVVVLGQNRLRDGQTVEIMRSRDDNGLRQNRQNPGSQSSKEDGKFGGRSVKPGLSNENARGKMEQDKSKGGGWQPDPGRRPRTEKAGGEG
jgi:RND family efflux transporter MFP subunit